MRQQINLYQAVLIDKPQPLQARQAGLILLACIALLLLFSLLGYRQLRSTETQLAGLEQQRAEVIARIAELEKKYPLREKNALLEEKIQQVEQQLSSQKQLLDYFSMRGAQGNDSILEVLDGLARHRQEGLWLQKIKLDAVEQNILLAGSALRPEQVPQYLQSLAEQDVLSGQVFSRLKLTRMEEQPGLVNFSLESMPGEQR